MSKSWRLVELAGRVFEAADFAVDLLDLSRTTSEFGRMIHPCKSCFDLDGVTGPAVATPQLLPRAGS